MTMTRANFACIQPAVCQLPSQTIQSPSTQVRIIAGLMMTRSSFRSMTLKVSDCFEPTSASQ